MRKSGVGTRCHSNAKVPSHKRAGPGWGRLQGLWLQHWVRVETGGGGKGSGEVGRHQRAEDLSVRQPPNTSASGREVCDTGAAHGDGDPSGQTEKPAHISPSVTPWVPSSDPREVVQWFGTLQSCGSRLWARRVTGQPCRAQSGGAIVTA